MIHKVECELVLSFVQVNTLVQPYTMKFEIEIYTLPHPQGTEREYYGEVGYIK